MTEPASLPAANNSARKMVLAVVMTLAFLLLCVVSPSAVEQLLLGWLYLPARVLPHTTVDPPTLVLGLVCGCVAVVIMHRVLKWVVRNRTGSGTQHWTYRSTLILSSLILLLFAAGTAMVGATHQSVWLITGAAERGVQLKQPPPVTGILHNMERSVARQRFSNQFHQIGLATHNFHDIHGTFPFGAMNDRGTQLHGWIVHLLPYLIYTNHEVDFRRPWNATPNDRLFRCALPEVMHPSIPDMFDDAGYGLSHVAANIHVVPIIIVPEGVSVDSNDLAQQDRNSAEPFIPELLSMEGIHDGTANTILAGEVVEHFRPWGHPGTVRDPAHGINRSPDGFGCLLSESGALFLMCDGSLRTVSPDVDAAVMRALSTPNGGEPISGDF